VGRLWRDEWQKMYPDLASDWRSTVSRYNYHFGSIDSLNPDFDDPEKILVTIFSNLLLGFEMFETINFFIVELVTKCRLHTLCKQPHAPVINL
jgi:hypothetical protein